MPTWAGRWSGRGQQVGNGIQHQAGPQVAKRRAGADRGNLAGLDRAGQALLQLLVGQGPLFQEFFDEVVIGFRHILHQIVPQGLRLLGQFLGDLACLGLAAAVAFEKPGLAAGDIHHPAKFVLGADGQIQDHGVQVKGGADLVHHLAEVGALPVHLGDADHAGQFPFPDHGDKLLGLIANPDRRPYGEDGAVRDLGGKPGLVDKVVVAGGIRQKYLPFFPGQMTERGADGDVALGFFRLKIHAGRTVVNPAQALDRPRGIEQGFRQTWSCRCYRDR